MIKRYFNQFIKEEADIEKNKSLPDFIPLNETIQKENSYLVELEKRVDSFLKNIRQQCRDSEMIMRGRERERRDYDREMRGRYRERRDYDRERRDYDRDYDREMRGRYRERRDYDRERRDYDRERRDYVREMIMRGRRRRDYDREMYIKDRDYNSSVEKRKKIANNIIGNIKKGYNTKDILTNKILELYDNYVADNDVIPCVFYMLGLDRPDQMKGCFYRSIDLRNNVKKVINSN